MIHSLGGCGTLPTEGGAVNSHPETNIRLQLPVRRDYDRRPAQPAHRAATIRPGWFWLIYSFASSIVHFLLWTVKLCVFSESGAVPSHCHAHGEHAVSPGEETHSATEWNHPPVGHRETSHFQPHEQKWSTSSKEYIVEIWRDNISVKWWMNAKNVDDVRMISLHYENPAATF